MLEKLPAGVSMLWTFVLVLFGWVLFDTDTIGGAWQYFLAMFGAGGAAIDDLTKYLLPSNALLLAVCILAAAGVGGKNVAELKKQRPVFAGIAAIPLKMAGLLVCTAALITGEYNPFLYFRF